MAKGEAGRPEIELTEKQIDDIMNRMFQKCGNFVMDGFWDCLYACVEEKLEESK